MSDLAVSNNSVYVATIDLPLTYTNLNYPVPVKAAGPLRGEVEVLNLATGKVQWDTRVSQFPLGATTVSNDLVFTTLYDGLLIALDRSTGKIVYRHQLPASTNAPIAIAGDTVIVPAGGPRTATTSGNPSRRVHGPVSGYSVAIAASTSRFAARRAGHVAAIRPSTADRITNAIRLGIGARCW